MFEKKKMVRDCIYKTKYEARNGIKTLSFWRVYVGQEAAILVSDQINSAYLDWI